MNSVSLLGLKSGIIDRKIDHIVYVVTDLGKATNTVEQLLGVRPVFGGYHKTLGTKNALLNLNNQMYLELLAADDSNTEITSPRWMGVDISSKNQITRWALKSASLKEDASILKKYQPDMGEIKMGSRISAEGSVLQWELLMPLATPEVELVPFLVDWSNTAKHPSEILPNTDCELIELYGTHPRPDAYAAVFESLEYPFLVKRSKEVTIKAIIRSPKGIVEI